MRCNAGKCVGWLGLLDIDFENGLPAHPIPHSSYAGGDVPECPAPDDDDEAPAVAAAGC